MCFVEALCSVFFHFLLLASHSVQGTVKFIIISTFWFIPPSLLCKYIMCAPSRTPNGANAIFLGESSELQFDGKTKLIETWADNLLYRIYRWLEKNAENIFCAVFQLLATATVAGNHQHRQLYSESHTRRKCWTEYDANVLFMIMIILPFTLVSNASENTKFLWTLLFICMDPKYKAAHTHTRAIKGRE